jgi:hypothetical protein
MCLQPEEFLFSLSKYSFFLHISVTLMIGCGVDFSRECLGFLKIPIYNLEKNSEVYVYILTCCLISQH